MHLNGFSPVCEIRWMFLPFLGISVAAAAASPPTSSVGECLMMAAARSSCSEEKGETEWARLRPTAAEAGLAVAAVAASAAAAVAPVDVAAKREAESILI